MKRVYTVSQPTSRVLFAMAQPVYRVSEPTDRGLFGRSAKVTPGDCWPLMQHVYTVSNSTYREMLVQGAVTIHSRGTKVEKMLTLAPERYTAGFCMVAKVILWCI